MYQQSAYKTGNRPGISQTHIDEKGEDGGIHNIARMCYYMFTHEKFKFMSDSAKS